MSSAKRFDQRFGKYGPRQTTFQKIEIFDPLYQIQVNHKKKTARIKKKVFTLLNIKKQ
jgi:hypothetical protein